MVRMVGKEGAFGGGGEGMNWRIGIYIISVETLGQCEEDPI